jgi:single-strand DNA-binding protein
MSVNLVIQLGHLSKDPELNHTDAGTPVLNCTIATNRSVPKGDKYVDEATYVDFTMWGKRAEAFVKYHKKGSRAYLEGRLSLETWTDRTTSKARSRLKMTAEKWEFVDGSGKRTDPGIESEPQPQIDETPF